ncbi:unnamed protein product [Paramecium pentaurelia]|uniref:Uncharacterized protein n=1 Tax=Paramecium pentaurelia TaxID=43138 RepID=A0A8S1SJV9_9CILI|nr:unnamed protein product [Paramecium pentaurelia]
MDCEPEITYISQTNQFIIVCNTDQILLYDKQTNAKLKYQQPYLMVQQFAFDEDTSKIAVDYEDNSILIFQIHNNNQIVKVFQSPPAHFNKITGLIFYEQGKKLITCSHDEMIFIWDLNTFEVIHQINQLKGKIQHQILFHNQKFLTTISQEGYTCIYNLQNKKTIYFTNRVQAKIQEICGIKQNLMKNEKFLVQIDDKIKIISLNRQKILRVLQFEGEFIDAQFCLNDRAILLINYIDLKLVDFQSGIILKTIPYLGNCYYLDKDNDILIYGDIQGNHYKKLSLSI